METEDVGSQLKALDEEITQCHSMVEREKEKLERYKVCFSFQIYKFTISCFEKLNSFLLRV